MNYRFKSIVKYVIFCTIDFAIPLWYLIAMIETYFFWYFIVKTGKETLLLKLLPALFIMQVLLICVCDTIGAAWFWKVNFVARALPWFLFGYYAHFVEAGSRENCKDRNLLIMAVTGLAVVLMPVVFHTKVNFSSLGLLPYAIGLFLLAVKYQDIKAWKPLAYTGDRLSLNIYVFHVPINGAINIFAGHVMKWNIESELFLWTEPLFTLAAAIAWAFILDRIKILAGRM